MKNFSKLTTTLIILSLCITVIVGLQFVLRPSNGEDSPTNSPRSKGDQRAALQIKEFIDFQCPMCAEGAMKLKKFMEENPGKVHLQMRYFPLNMHPHAFLSARYAECASRQGKFWPFHDLILERQKQWEYLFDARPAFDLMAQDAQLDLQKLQQCLQDPSVEAAIYADKQEGRKLGVNSTPTYLVNGELVVGPFVLEEKLNSFKTP